MENRNTSVMSIQDWIITILITSIPVVNIIMLFVWAFGSDTNENKKNWAKATLIWLAIIFVLYLIIFVFLGLALFTGSR
ncbi:hypothetical protein [Fulvivirga sedimenti]|uniref:Uncharacterized protein n=1 Tax=Fulvivirga sedimenti TaxID=2879465 RepID=A0A9X1KZI7_9BACT|nr:hypothetical protein [Fulvivirga sedimenti]MCA6074731.1 hypothetical protein [Fulvivirga sedimenti]MCA6075908.1 hypothetical protein [Fulvivirga sedimenti]MCA6077036.1 hypothetical protein [Fulvivirga sedimenti]